MHAVQEIGIMRSRLWDIIRKHPELDDFVVYADQNLWAIQVALEIDYEEEGDPDDE